MTSLGNLRGRAEPAALGALTDLDLVQQGLHLGVRLHHGLLPGHLGGVLGPGLVGLLRRGMLQVWCKEGVVLGVLGHMSGT